MNVSREKRFMRNVFNRFSKELAMFHMKHLDFE